MAQRSIETVILGVDFSKYSKVAYGQAVLLAQRFGATMVVVHVVQDYSFMDGKLYSDAKKAAIQYYEKEIRKIFPNINSAAEIKVKFGKPEEEIVKLSNDYRNSLIIVGHKGKGALKTFFIGSVSERLCLSSKVPVWIHIGNKKRLPSKIIIPCDLTNTTERLMKRVSGLQLTEALRATFLYVFTPAAPLLDYLSWVHAEKALLKHVKSKISKIHSDFPMFRIKKVEGDPANEILQASKHYDLIVMVPRNRDTFFHALGKVTTKVLRGSSVPVLIVP